MTRAEQAARLKDRTDPYHQLIAAILHQAVSDARGSQQAWTDGGADVRCTRLAAVHYLQGCPDLTELCELADCDSDRVQPTLLKAAGLSSQTRETKRGVGTPTASAPTRQGSVW